MKKLLALIALLPFAALAAPEERVVALGGDVTEIVYALGVQPSLVARDSTSQWPVAATALPDVGYLRQLNAEGILATRPTLVLASAQAQPSLALKQLEQSNVRVVTIPASNDLNAIDEKVRVIAEATHREAVYSQSWRDDRNGGGPANRSRCGDSCRRSTQRHAGR